MKTIAPQGVRPNYDSLWLDSVAIARAAGQVKVPAHVMPTQYRYNTLNQVIAQKSPDGGRTDFWYDRLGRLALSRNARQLAMSNSSNKYYSYTQYDALGRITEVGQLKDTEGQLVNDTFTRSATLLQDWYDNQLANREQITNTIYDIPYPGFDGVDPTLIVAQANVRNRVSYVSYTDIPGLTSSYDQASFYSYDIHGNVDTLLQDYGQSTTQPNIMNKNANRWKKIVYEYDLISGKVNKVMYQPRYSDQFTHRYFYDAENRLTEVHTSLDGFTWEREAKYEYYLHGPLARTVLGQQQVQGMDYAYTLQGWLKGVNSTGATATHDIGADGQLSSLNKYVARDALGFNLNYFHGDFQPINPGVSPFPAYRLGSGGLPDSVYRPLYNGNISSMATWFRKFEGAEAGLLNTYQYDQLNRLVKQDVYKGFNAGTNSYAALTSSVKYRERVRYDANGNILTYLRNGNADSDPTMDDMTYEYYAGTNRLRRIDDKVDSNRFGANSWETIVDIDWQRDSNYVYDAIGNLIQDKAEKITNIQWNVYGKIREITRNSLTTDRVTTTRTRYTYDAQGNRISKAVKSYKTSGNRYEIDFTWYVRDAQGNLLSSYTTTALDTSAGADLASLALKQADVQLYGSSRLGNLDPFPHEVDNGTGPWINPDYRGTTFYRSHRLYELTNHLGNVLTTISDRKIPVYSGSSLNLPGGFTVPIADYFEPDMVSATDYYPFGMVSRDISPSDINKKYRFGFNGKENDNEVKGFAQQQDYGMRIYDPRVGRFLSVDPLTREYPYYTPYSFAGNKPISAIDLDGLEEYSTNRDNEYVLWGTFDSWRSAVRTGITRGLEWATTDTYEGRLVRKALRQRGYTVSDKISNKTLGRNFQVFWDSDGANVKPESGFIHDVFDIGFGMLQAGSIYSPGKAGSGMLMSSASPLVTTTIADILKTLKIHARREEILKTFVDGADGKSLKAFEAESGAIAEEALGIKLKSAQKGDGFDYAIESGSIGGRSAMGKTIDQIGIPKSATNTFDMNKLLKSVTSHFNKSVDYILLDVRHLNKEQVKQVMDHINKNHMDKIDKLITIGN